MQRYQSTDISIASTYIIPPFYVAQYLHKRTFTTWNDSLYERLMQYHVIRFHASWVLSAVLGTGAFNLSDTPVQKCADFNETFIISTEPRLFPV